MKIRKAVIPAAGLGTRFLPATKSVPKELLPIVDKPILMMIAEEIAAAGFSEMILVTAQGKPSIEDFFAVAPTLEATLAKTGKSDLLKGLRDLRERLKVTSVFQPEALGLGHAVQCAEPVVGREPFAVLLGDEIVVTRAGQDSGVGQLKRIAEETQKSVVAVIEVAKEDVTKYGIIDGKLKSPNLWEVHGVVEKPSVEKAPSRLALPGRYVFSAEIFDCLRDTKPGRNGEIQLSDAMHLLAQRTGLLATTIEGQRFDAGDKLGFLKANVELALEHPELGKPFREYLTQRFGGRT